MKVLLKRLFVTLGWVYPVLGAILRKAQKDEKRILAIWDTKSQPFALGDMLSFIEAAEILRHLKNVDKIDVCFLSDAADYVRPGTTQTEITVENRLSYLLGLVRLLQVDEHIGSFLVFDSHYQMTAYIGDNGSRYYIWPPTGAFLGREYLYYRIFELASIFHLKNGYVPHLKSAPPVNHWARGFAANQIVPNLSVVVQIRSNSGWDERRNSNIPAWLDLFTFCQGRFPVKFIVICAKDEIDPRLRQMPNVILAKDHGTTVEQDLALIENCAIYLATSSGMALMAWFGKVPYAIFNLSVADMHSLAPSTVVRRADGTFRWQWATEHQRLVAERDTSTVLIREFQHLYKIANP
jgi:hypothetical protein